MSKKQQQSAKSSSFVKQIAAAYRDAQRDMRAAGFAR